MKYFILSKVKTLRDKLRLSVSKLPVVYRYSYGLKASNRHLIVNEKTVCVVDGFPRSGNTFIACLLETQLPTLAFSHHQHNFSNILDARRSNIPILLLFRNPYDVIPSYILRNKYTTASSILSNWRVYYESILDLGYQNIYTLEFTALIKTPRVCINNFFNKSGLSFSLPELSDSSFQLVKERQLQLNALYEANDPIRSAFPSEEKEQRKAQLSYSVQSSDLIIDQIMARLNALHV